MTTSLALFFLPQLVTISSTGAVALKQQPQMEEIMKFKALCMGIVVMGGLSITSASAHHSFAMFDAEKNVKLDGTSRNSNGRTRTAGS